MKTLFKLIPTLALICLVGCSNMTQREQSVLSGSAMGAVGGAAVGSIAGNAGSGALVGAGVGALGGYLYDRNHR